MDFIIFDSKNFALGQDEPNDVKQFRWYRRKDVIPPGDMNHQFLGINIENKDWLENAMSEKTVRVFAFARVTYVVPPISLNDEPKEKIIEESFRWNGLFQKWMTLDPKTHERIHSLIEKEQWLQREENL